MRGALTRHADWRQESTSRQLKSASYSVVNFPFVPVAGRESRVESSLEISSIELRWASALSWWFSLLLGSHEWKIPSPQWFAQYSFPKDGLVPKAISFVLTFVLSKCAMTCYKAHNLQPVLKVNTTKRGRWCPPELNISGGLGCFALYKKYIFFVALGLLWRIWAFSSCGEQAPLFVAVTGFSLLWFLLWSTGSKVCSFRSCSLLALDHWLRTSGAWA